MQVYRAAALPGFGEQYAGAALPHAGRLTAQPRCRALLVKRQTYSAFDPASTKAKPTELPSMQSSSEDALLIACRSGDLQNVQQAVQQGASITAQSKAGGQPIHAACSHGHLPIVQWLVQQSASITAETKAGSQPIHASPAEHQATPDRYDLGEARFDWPEAHGNLLGWIQYRKTLPGECAGCESAQSNVNSDLTTPDHDAT